MGSTSGVSKVLDKIKGTLDSGSFYEAQQMYKTVYYRHKARKQLQESYHILKEGAVQQLHSQQVTCGVELGLLLLEAYNNDQVQAGPQPLQGIQEIIDAFPDVSTSQHSDGPVDPTTSAQEECARFVTAAVKWANKQGPTEAARKVHDMYANYVWKKFGLQGLGRATAHFVRGSDAAAYAAALHEISEHAAKGEEDLIIARAVLQILATAQKSNAAQQLGHATLVLQHYRKLRPQLDTPLINFTTYLLKALERRSLQLVLLLCDRYEPSLFRDACLEAYLSKVQQVYLNVGASSGGPFGGLLGSLLKGLSEGEQGDEEDDEEYHDV